MRPKIEPCTMPEITSYTDDRLSPTSICWTCSARKLANHLRAESLTPALCRAGNGFKLFK